MVKEIRRHKNASPTTKGKIIGLSMAGISSRNIANEFGVSKDQVRRLKNKFMAGKDLSRAKGQGRKRKTTARDDRLIIQKVKKDRFTTGVNIAAADYGNNLSPTTIRRRIVEKSDFKSYWAAAKPFINEKQRKRRLEWAKEKVTWSLHEWRTVLWSDESPFVFRYKGKTRVWRLPNERHKPWATKANVKHDSKINVWGSFSATGVGILHKIDGIMNKEQYLDIMENCMQPSKDMLFGPGNGIFQQDNDPKHTSNIVKSYLADQGVNVMDWPAQSPDLNPIENLWSILDSRCKARRPKNEDELFKFLKYEWNKLPLGLLDSLVASMPHRCQAVIDNHGWATKY